MKSVNQTAVVLLAAPFRGGVPGPLALERRGHQDPAPAHAGRAVREPPGLGRLPHGGQPDGPYAPPKPGRGAVRCGAERSGAVRDGQFGRKGQCCMLAYVSWSCGCLPAALLQVYGVVLPLDSDPRLSPPYGGGGHSELPAVAGAGRLRAAAASSPVVPAAPFAFPAVAAGLPPTSSTAAAIPTAGTAAAPYTQLPQELPALIQNPPAIVMEYVAGRSLG